jgi:hypothetical protein
MTNKDLIKQLKAEGMTIEIDKERILSQIPRQEQHKPRLVSWHPKLAMTLGLIMLVVLGIALFRQTPTTSSIVTMDINPSIEFTVDSNDQVTAYRALNLDGEVLIETVILTQLSINEAIEVVMEQATSLGYMTQTSVVNINAFNEISSIENKLNERIQAHFQSRIQMIEITDALIHEARALKITPRKLALIQEILEMDSTYTMSVLRTYDIQKLNEIKRGYVADELSELKEKVETLKVALDAQKAALLLDVDAYISEIGAEIVNLKNLYSYNLIEFNMAYSTFSNAYFPNAQVPLLPSLKYQRLLQLESKMDAYESYLKQQVEALFEASIRGLYSHLVDTHANIVQLNQWQTPNHAIGVLTSIEIYLDASLYDQLFLASAKRLDVLLNQASSGSGIAYNRILSEAYQEFMVYYSSNQVNEALKQSTYIQNIILQYQQKEQ